MCMSPWASEKPDLLVFEMGPRTVSGLVTWAVMDPDLFSGYPGTQDLDWRLTGSVQFWFMSVVSLRAPLKA